MTAPSLPTLGVDDLKAQWNAQADCHNQWDELGLDEIVEFAQATALAGMAKRLEAAERDAGKWRNRK